MKRMKKIFTFALMGLAALAVQAQQYKTGDEFDYTNAEGITKHYKIVGDNLIENPSFDNNTDGWLGGAGGALSSTTWNSTGGVDGGAYIVPTSNSGKGDNNSIGTAWELELGKTYVFSYFINNTSNTEAVAKEGYIVTSQTNTPRGDETMTLMYAHEDANLAWTQNTIVTTAQYQYLQFCARWLGGAHGFDAFILAEVEEAVDPKELATLLENCSEWMDYFGEEAAEYTTFEDIVSDAWSMVDYPEEYTADDFNTMVAKVKDALLDFRMANANDENIVDVTSRYIKNASFDNGMVDWETNNSAVNNGMNCRVQSYFQEVTDRVIELNGLPGADTYFQQTVTGLPKGYYIFSVQCVMTHTAGEGEQTGAYIFCNGAEQDMKTAEMTGSDAAFDASYPETFSIRGVVTDDDIVVGLMGKADGLYSYVAIDNVRLEYAGFNVGIYLQALCEEVDAYLAEHIDELLPNIAASLEDEVVEANGILGSSDEEMNAEYDKLDKLFKEAKNSINKMAELTDAINSLVDLLNTTEYPGAEAAVAATEQAQDLIDGNVDDATYQTILDMIAFIEQARKDYMLSQEATHDDPADYSFLINNPECYTNAIGWTGNNPGFEYNVAEFYNMDWDMSQTIEGLPNGLYEVSLTGFFRTGANDGGEAYRAGSENLIAKLYANKFSTSIMSLYTFTSGEAGCTDDGTNGYINVRQHADEAFNNGFYTANKVKVIVTDGTLTIGVRGEGHENTSWFAFRDFKLSYFGAATDEDMKSVWEEEAAKADGIEAILLNGDREAFGAQYTEAKALASEGKYMDAFYSLQPVNEAYESIAATTKSFLAGSYATASASSDAALQAAAGFAKNAIEAANATSEILADLDAKLKAYIDYAAYVVSVKELTANAARNKYQTSYVTVVNEIIAANEVELKEHLLSTNSVSILTERLQKAVAAMQKSALISITEGSDVTSLLIANADITDSTPTGWSIILGTGNQPTNTGQYWTGNTDERYLDSWNGTAGRLNFTAYQILSDIPNGTYTLSCHARGSGENAFLFAATAPYDEIKNDSTMAIAVTNASTKWALFPNDADLRGELWTADSLIWDAGGEQSDIFQAHEGTGWGWAIRTIDDIVVDNHVMTFGITCDSTLTGKPFTGTWYSADEFRLTLKTLGDNSDYVIDTQVANISAAQARTECFTLDGRQVAEPQKGITIIRSVAEDGTVTVRKVFVK